MTKLRDFDPANYLTDDETIAHYLAQAAQEPDPDAFLQALGDVARARGIGTIATAKLPRPALVAFRS